MAILKEWTLFESTEPKPERDVLHIYGRKTPINRTVILFGAFVSDIPEEFYNAFELPVIQKLKDFTDDKGYYAYDAENPANSAVGFIAAVVLPGETRVQDVDEVKEAATSWARLRNQVLAETGITIPIGRRIVAVERGSHGQ